MTSDDVESQIAQLLRNAAREQNPERLDELLNEIRFLFAVIKGKSSSPHPE